MTNKQRIELQISEQRTKINDILETGNKKPRRFEPANRFDDTITEP